MIRFHFQVKKKSASTEVRGSGDITRGQCFTWNVFDSGQGPGVDTTSGGLVRLPFPVRFFLDHAGYADNHVRLGDVDDTDAHGGLSEGSDL